MPIGGSPQVMPSNYRRRIRLNTPAIGRGPSEKPLSEMNVTPFIDVLLVLIIMLIMVIPIATHSLDIPLPSGDGELEVLETNTVSIDARDRLYWNSQRIDRQGLLNQLATSNAGKIKPLLRFDPAPNASYDASANTISLIKDSGAENFAFVGNHRHRDFTR